MTNKNSLALLGGRRVISYKFKKYNSLGKEEAKAASKVVKSGILSGFIATKSKEFYGGKYVKKFETKCSKFFKVRYAISVNSWTSGLIAAVGAIDISPGDEIIVSPFTMSASVTAIIHWNAIPVFADIDRNTFCLDPKSVIEKITKKTKAIMLVDINGHPSDIDAFKVISKRFNLKLIIDSAQSIGAKYLNYNKFAGTLGDVGGFSLNVHKHINTGEGGIVVTNSKKIAEKVYLIRNHGEQVLSSNSKKKLRNIIGYNFRMGEIEAAIGIEQLKKFPKILLNIQILANQLIQGLKNLEGLQVPFVKQDVTHAFYTFPLVLDIDRLKISRKKIVAALKAEGVPCRGGYLNIHKLPMYKMKIAYGAQSFPWILNKEHKVRYKNQKLNIAEEMHAKKYIAIGMCSYKFNKKDINMIINSFKKVWSNLELLKKK